MDRVYECEFYRLTADERSCFFCDHCTDIFWDTKGPYMFFCEVDADVEVEKDGNVVSGKSIMALMTLEATCGTVLKVTASGPQAKEALDNLEDLVARKFDIPDEQ